MGFDGEQSGAGQLAEVAAGCRPADARFVGEDAGRQRTPVVKGDIPDYAIAVGAPAKVVKNRKLAWETSAAERAALAAALADIERKKASR